MYSMLNFSIKFKKENRPSGFMSLKHSICTVIVALSLNYRPSCEVIMPVKLGLYKYFQIHY